MRGAVSVPVRLTFVVGDSSLRHDGGECTQCTQSHRAAGEGGTGVQAQELLLHEPLHKHLQTPAYS